MTRWNHSLQGHSREPSSERHRPVECNSNCCRGAPPDLAWTAYRLDVGKRLTGPSCKGKPRALSHFQVIAGALRGWVSVELAAVP